MCLPALPLIAIAATAASTAVSFFGAQQTANAQASAYEYQAAVGRNNAIIAERNAQAAEDAGRTEEQRQRQKTAQLEGTARAAMAANGIDTTSGTALNVLGDTAKLGELDALTIRSNAGRQAYNFRVQGMSETAQAGLDSMSAKSASAAGQISGMGSLLSGATSLSDKFMGWQKQGIFGGSSSLVDPASYGGKRDPLVNY